MKAERASGLGIAVLRVFFVVVGAIDVLAAVTGNAGGALAATFTLLFGVLQLVTGVVLRDDRRWSYGMALLLVGLGVIADIVVLRVPGLIVYVLFMVALLAPATRKRWSRSTETA